MEMNTIFDDFIPSWFVQVILNRFHYCMLLCAVNIQNLPDYLPATYGNIKAWPSGMVISHVIITTARLGWIPFNEWRSCHAIAVTSLIQQAGGGMTFAAWDCETFWEMSSWVTEKITSYSCSSGFRGPMRDERCLIQIWKNSVPKTKFFNTEVRCS